MLKQTIAFLLSTYLIASDMYYYNNNQKVYLTPQESNQSRLQNKSVPNPHAAHYYKTSSNTQVGITDEILIKTKNLDAVLHRYDVTLKKRITSDIYLLKAKESALTLDISNQMYEDSNILYAHPNFIRQIDNR